MNDRTQRVQLIRAEKDEPMPELLAYSIQQAQVAAGVGRNLIYNAMNAGELRSFRVGRRRLIAVAELRAWIERIAKAEA